MTPLLAFTACSGTGTTPPGSDGASQTISSAGTDSRPSAAVVTDYLSYVDGKAGAADAALAPITVGRVNVEGGPAGTPEATQGARAAVKYVNEKLGGIG